MLIKKALLPSAVFASLRSLNSIEEPRPRLSASVFSPAWATICFFSASKMFLMQCESNSFLSPEDTQWSRRFRIQVVNDTLYHTNGSVSLHNDSVTLTGVSVTRIIACNLTYMRQMSRMISLSRLLSSKVSKVLKVTVCCICFIIFYQVRHVFNSRNLKTSKKKSFLQILLHGRSIFTKKVPISGQL